MLSALICHFNFVCQHDLLFKKLNISDGPRRESLGDSETFDVSDKWRPFRIKFNYDFMDGKKEYPLRCDRVGQVLDSGFRCEKENVLTDAQRNALKQTIDNVIKFLQNTIKVKSLRFPIKVSNLEDYGDFDEIVFNDADLGIVATSIALDSTNSIIAAAAPRVFIKPSYRPYIGVMYFNPRFVPEKPCDYTDFESKFFYTVLHELTHAIGFLSSAYWSFHPYEQEDKLYITSTCQLTKYNKKYNFLVTPYAHLYAKKRFGVDKFYGDKNKSCPAGIELEDQGGQTTAGSHLENELIILNIWLDLFLMLMRHFKSLVMQQWLF
ncbi:GP63-like [Trichomonas vaginalis G3]|uniref:GP63-like n=1 Tax=Trichomonas vaginalis (strain ATCC PRA-98 / G3) TaxID=412133 RepID=A2DU89_TRIV3|nr:regulation of choline O-acetyltransferase protein [Trichomonas vaginalis G3]EAY16082.1 GP63-like [Trichomonas vaginalis G3]KAI5537251.1 regulation of choline O-acetyltransferase protein [Trichomonas vaginalis G3]|eukprot:XP_001328305.1 GP63-like [Trichomonas vaginalis G3]